MEIKLIKQAITKCKEQLVRISTYLCYYEGSSLIKNIESHKKEIDLLNITIKALEEMLEREQDCTHCTGAILGFYEVDESCNLTIFDINAKFCPKCGRKIYEVKHD